MNTITAAEGNSIGEESAQSNICKSASHFIFYWLGLLTQALKKLRKSIRPDVFKGPRTR